MHHSFEPLPPAAELARESADAVLAKNLLVARAVRGVTQHELSEASGISRATIAQLESGCSDPRLSTITQVAEALGIPPLLLLVGPREARALAELPRKLGAAGAPPPLVVPASDLVKMRAWIGSGMLKDRLRAARQGATVAEAAGASSLAARVSAAILSGILPGPGTVVGATLGELLDEPTKPAAALPTP